LKWLATNGDTRLGGTISTAAWPPCCWRKCRCHCAVTPTSAAKAIAAAEAAKIPADQDGCNGHGIACGNGAVATPPDTSEFESTIADVVERTIAPCRQALKDAGVSPRDLDEVVLVGGSTRVPLVRRRVEEFFGRTPHTELNPEEVVALGAAVQAGVLSGRKKGHLAAGRCAPLLGIETMGGHARLIERNTTIPVTAKQVFTPSPPTRPSSIFHVLQGDVNWRGQPQPGAVSSCAASNPNPLVSHASK